MTPEKNLDYISVAIAKYIKITVTQRNIPALVLGNNLTM